MKPAELLTAFERLSLREKGAVALAVLALPGFLIHQFLLQPALTSLDSWEKRLVQAQAESARIAMQISAMENEVRTRDAAAKTRLDGLNNEMLTQEKRFLAVTERMVAAKDMPQLLQSLLKKRPGLSLAYLRTRGPEPVRLSMDENDAKVTPAAGAAAVPGAGRRVEEIYLHGVDVAVEGSYADLLAWMADLEKQPQKMLWAGMRLQVREYPRSTLELKLQTLSREKTWLEL